MGRSEEHSQPSSNSEGSAKPTPKTGFARLWPAIKHSLAGLATTFRTETAFRQEVGFFVLLFPSALFLGNTTVEKVLLAAPLFLVLICELLNTALESAVDRWGFEYNDYTKKRGAESLHRTSNSSTKEPEHSCMTISGESTRVTTTEYPERLHFYSDMGLVPIPIRHMKTTSQDKSSR